MNSDTQKTKNTAAEAYRNRMKAYAAGMRNLAEKKKVSGASVKKGGTQP